MFFFFVEIIKNKSITCIRKVIFVFLRSYNGIRYTFLNKVPQQTIEESCFVCGNLTSSNLKDVQSRPSKSER
jgi:hypothetical protein